MNTSKNIRRHVFLYTLISLIITAAAITLRCVNLFLFYDTDIGYYKTDALLPIAEPFLLISAVLFFGIFSSLLFRKAPIGCEKATPLAIRIASGLAAAGFLFLAITDFVKNGSLFDILFCLGAIAYFILIAAKNQHALFRLLTGLCVILRLITALAKSYFNVYVQMNAPDKLMFQLGCLAGMLFLVCELRASISEMRPALYIFSTGCAAVFLGTAALPSILACHAEILSNTDLLGAYYAQLGLFLYSAARLFSLTRSPITEPQAESSCDEPAIQKETNEEAEDSSAETKKAQQSEEIPESTEETASEEAPKRQETPPEE